MSTEPMIVCPSCSTEIKLTESLAAPLIKDVRADYERKMASNEAEMSRRESDSVTTKGACRCTKSDR